jgi:hemerythrin-like domain-containing protein
MLEEHAEGRALIQAMAASEPADWARAARRYVGFLRDHIDKENSIVFPLADAVLDAQAVQVVSRDFESVQVRQGRAASIDEAGAAVDRLAATLASPADRCEPGSVVRPRKAGC